MGLSWWERFGYFLERLTWIHWVLLKKENPSGRRVVYVNRINGHSVLKDSTFPVAPPEGHNWSVEPSSSGHGYLLELTPVEFMSLTHQAEHFTRDTQIRRLSKRMVKRHYSVAKNRPSAIQHAEMLNGMINLRK